MTPPAASADAERDALALFDGALDVAPEARDAWLDARCTGDTVLRDRVRALLRADDAEAALLSRLGDGAAARRAESLRPPPTVGPYRLDELIGSGGMGAVYRAHRADGLFEQTVAVKFVRPMGGRVAVEALIDAERRLLARMNHPGIARILDGGTSAEGLHYLVMEFVQGLPIDRHIEEGRLPVRTRVELLREVCEAVADAHRHLVLHCDLKPANILVDAQGRPKLIDFGIARLRDALDAALPIGYTRGYASPQRLAGEAPTVADDVYALGMLLAELAGGELPAGAAQVVPRRAFNAELAAVAQRALAEEPAQRYASVEALSADLQRWLEQRPVSALPPHWRYRATKLLQRHPLRVAGGAFGLLGLLVALAVIATLYARADAARREAERRFTEVRSLANYMLFDLDLRLENTPGTTALRRELVERGQLYLDTLARTAGGDTGLRREIAVGLGRLAEIQGGWAIPNVGDRAAARPNFERAEAMLRELVQRRGDEWTWQRDLGRVQARLADFYGGIDNDARKQLAKAREAEAHLRRALVLAEQARVGVPDSAELHTLLSSARLTQSFALNWIDDAATAETLARDEEARLLALPEAVRRAMEFDYRAGRAAVHDGDALYFLNRFDDALLAYRRAQQRYDTGLATRPNDRRLLDGLAVATWSASLTLTELGRHAEALVESDAGLARVERLLALDPSNDNVQRFRLILQGDRALVLGRLQRFGEAIVLSERMLAERRGRAERTPDISEPARDALVPLHALADLYWDKGDPAAACTVARRAIADWAAYERRWGLSEYDRKLNEQNRQKTQQRCR